MQLYPRLLVIPDLESRQPKFKALFCKFTFTQLQDLLPHMAVTEVPGAYFVAEV